jgi:hypothetical protein
MRDIWHTSQHLDSLDRHISICIYIYIRKVCLSISILYVPTRFHAQMAGSRVPLAGSQSIRFIYLFSLYIRFSFFLSLFQSFLPDFSFHPCFFFLVFFCVCLCGWMFACNAHSAYVSFNVGSFFVVSFLFPSFCSSLSISFPPLSSATRLLLCYFFFFSSYSLLRLQLSKCRNLTEECVAVKVKTKMENDRTKEIKKKKWIFIIWVYYSCIF